MPAAHCSVAFLFTVLFLLRNFEREKKSIICGSMITVSSYFLLVCLVVYSMCKYAEASHVILQSADWTGRMSEA